MDPTVAGIPTGIGVSKVSMNTESNPGTGAAGTKLASYKARSGTRMAKELEVATSIEKAMKSKNQRPNFAFEADVNLPQKCRHLPLTTGGVYGKTQGATKDRSVLQ